jgi:integrase/recombinase XerD
MTALAPHLASFLREHLPKERRASQHTCEAYAQSFLVMAPSTTSSPASSLISP